MKEYLLFAGWIYYPGGGWMDFVQDFNTIEEAKKFIDEGIKTKPRDFGWYHIVDLEKGKIIWD